MKSIKEFSSSEDSAGEKVSKDEKKGRKMKEIKEFSFSEDEAVKKVFKDDIKMKYVE